MGWGCLSVSTERAETWAQRSSSRQRQLQAAETLSEREREHVSEMWWEGGFRHLPAIPCSASIFPGATPCSPLPHSVAPYPQRHKHLAIGCLPSSPTNKQQAGDSGSAETPALWVLPCRFFHGGKATKPPPNLWGSGHYSVWGWRRPAPPFRAPHLEDI